MMKQKCYLCKKPLLFFKYDWGYIFGEEGVSWAHLDCVEWDALMERVLTEELLMENLGRSWS